MKVKHTNIDEFVQAVAEQYNEKSTVRTSNRQKSYFLKVGAGFDIETTNVEESKTAYMYIWMFTVGEHTINGRTWAEFRELLKKLNKVLSKKGAHLLVYIANESFEFSFLRNRFQFDDVFMFSEREPLFAIYKHFEFRDCLKLTGGSLKSLARNYCQTQKLDGYDYEKPRNSKTPLTERELQYCDNDAIICAEFGDYVFNTYNYKIPLTQTGIIRQEVKDMAFGGDKDKRKAVYRKIKELFPKSYEVYNAIMKYLFRGGYTHANAFYTGKVLDNTFGFDFDSSYPAVMQHFQYPMTPFKRTELKVIDGKIEDKIFDQSKAYYFVAVFKNIERTTFHTIEQAAKLIEPGVNVVLDNGRIAKADEIKVMLTEQDYYTYLDFYEWEDMEIRSAYVSDKAPLPDYVLKPMQNAYKGKLQMKKKCKAYEAEHGKESFELNLELLITKQKLNSSYGMMVTRLAIENYIFTPITENTGIRYNWSGQPAQNRPVSTIEKHVDASPENYQSLISEQFLSPFWGIWVTAYARRQLLRAVKWLENAGCHVYYCDTDSLYLEKTQTAIDVIARYNSYIFKQNEELEPEFKKMGTFDEIREDTCTFKTLGAKRYIKWFENDEIVTVAGMRHGTYQSLIVLDEKPCCEYHETADGKYISKEDFFECFEDGIMLDAEESLKLTTRYNDAPHDDEVTDEFGNTEIMHEESSVCLYKIPFKMKVSDLYACYTRQLQNDERIEFSA